MKGNGGAAKKKDKLKKAGIHFSNDTKKDDGSPRRKKFQLGGRTPPVERQKSLYPASKIELKPISDAEQEQARQKNIEFQQLKTTLRGQVYEIVNKRGFVHPSKDFGLINRFFHDIGIDDSYFKYMSPELIADHIQTIYSYKVLKSSGQTDDHIESLYIKQDFGDSFSLYSTQSSLTGAGALRQLLKLEREIEARFLREGYVHDKNYPEISKNMKSRPWRVECFSTEKGVDDSDGDYPFPLRFYVLREPSFEYNPDVVDDFNVSESMGTDLLDVADPEFLDAAPDVTKDLYQGVLDEVVTTMYPVVRIADRSNTPHEKKILIGYHHGTTHSLFSSLTDLYQSVGLYSTKKFVEQFKNGTTIICIWVRPLTYRQTGELDAAEFDECIQAFLHDLGTLFAKPRHKISVLMGEDSDDTDNILTVREASFLACCWQFAHQFLGQYRDEYYALLDSIKKNDSGSLNHLLKLKSNLREDTFSEDRIVNTWKGHAMFAKILYQEFRGRHHPRLAQKMNELPDLSHLEAMARKNAEGNEINFQIFMACINFLKHILKTNFFKREKLALSFRLHPDFLNKRDYPHDTFGIFYVCGSFFRGFHVRFWDISRGGIRIIWSPSRSAYERNTGRVFSENYNLAYTQLRKNKDIPEGGSKGTIILDHGVQRGKGAVMFRKYIDSLLDLIIPHEQVLDHYGVPEILFMGPDEGTAELMEWAALRARERGYEYWKAFTTGKPPSLGGVPHDVDGMTTRGVHQYVLSIIEKLGEDEANLSKCQTGGPDGDLGSNEIKISRDRTNAIVDGSGVLYDPNGIDRDEMMKCAQQRVMIDKFDVSKLGPGGFRVLCTDRDVTLPNGEQIENGMQFRNNFHFHPLFRADFFVPCGGRPEAINLNNVAAYFDENGQCRFRFIVEGANLFITDEARAYMEERGVILFKDASANKGGVTSSSLEVLAALALDDDQHSQHMCVPKGGDPPKFYRQYVTEIIQIIERNARDEFRCIWDEHERTGTPRCELTDILSNRINALNRELVASRLWEKKDIRRHVILDAVPPCLVELVGEKQLFERVPDAYLKAIFGAHFASMFVYNKGLNTSAFAFTDFLESIRERL